MVQVNAALGATFAGFAIWREQAAIRIEPLMHLSVARALIEQGRGDAGPGSVPWLWVVPERAEPPPMQWLTAAPGKPVHAHA